MKRLMTRTKVCEELVQKILSNILEENERGQIYTINDMAIVGGKGYGYMSKVELEKEYQSVFGEEIEIQD